VKKSRDSNQGLTETSRLLAEARRQFTEGRPDQAVTILQGILAKNPRELQALVALGIVAAETGRRVNAKECMVRALSLDPKCVPALCWISYLLLDEGQIDAARRHAEQALTVDPRNAAAHAAVARCLARAGHDADAIPRFKQATELNPNNPVVLYEYADSLIALGLELEAIKVLTLAIQLAPETRGLLRLAYLELGGGNIDEAERHCERALKRDPDHHSGHIIMGRILTERMKLEEAEVHWARAREIDPESSSNHLEKALSLTAIGHFDGAISELKQSIEEKPVQGSAYQSLIYAKRIVKDDLPLVRQMEGVLLQGSLSDFDRLSLLYSLGKSFDNLGDYETAIDYFDRANALKRRILGSQPFDRGAFKAFIDSRIKLYTEDFYRQCAGIGVESSLPIMIVGMMRSGTTLAEQMLCCHPLIGGAGEQHYWGDHENSMIDYAQSKAIPGRIRACAGDFLKLLSSIAPGFPHVIDKNPANLQVVGSLHLAFPNARIIHTRRNAIDTAISIWTTPMRTNAPFISDRENIVYAYKEYLRLMDHWRKVIPADRFMEVKYEDLVNQPENYARQLVGFCGLEWDEACLHPERNDRRVKTPSLWQVRQPVYKSSTERWRNYEPWLGAFEELRGL
jgi:tetratricopeptide (TPR) repeat protein